MVDDNYWHNKKIEYFTKNGQISKSKECELLVKELETEEGVNFIKGKLISNHYFCVMQDAKNINKMYVIDLSVSHSKSLKKGCLRYHFSSEENIHNYDCPNFLLDLLSDTSSPKALQWRQKCRNLNQKNEKKESLKELEPDSIVEVLWPFKSKHINKNDLLFLIKTKYKNHYIWEICFQEKNLRVSSKFIKYLDALDCYVIIRKGKNF